MSNKNNENVESKLLLEAGGPITLLIYGPKPNIIKWIIYRHSGDLEIYDSYIKFRAHKISKSNSGKKDGYINHTGIIPFKSIIPVSQYIKKLKKKFKKSKKIKYFTYGDSRGIRYFLCFFDSKDGWHEIPAYMKEYSGSLVKQLNTQLITSKDEYESILDESLMGPFIGFSFGIEEKDGSKKIQEEVYDLLNSLDFENPPVKIAGKINVNFQEFNKS